MIIEISTFSRKHFFLSNFYPSQLFYKDVKYMTSEHAYQATKCLYPEDHDDVRFAKTPADAKRLAREKAMKPHWKDLRVNIMNEIVHQKFLQNPVIASDLLETGDAILIEGNLWKDTFWGQCPVGKGENHLGKILMQVRDDLKILQSNT